MNAIDQRERSLDKARDALLKAAATAAQRPVTDESLAFALFQAVTGLMELAKADVGDKARTIMVAAVHRTAQNAGG